MCLLLVEIFGILVAVCLCILVSVAWHIHRQHQKYDHLPGPPRNSFWSGHMKSIEKVTAAGGIMDDYLIEISKTHGPVFRLCMWHHVIVFVLDPECIKINCPITIQKANASTLPYAGHVFVKDVLVTGNHPKSKQIYSRLTNVFGARFLGKGIETELNSKIWVLHRMHLQQWFKPSYIGKFASEFNEFADRYAEYLETKADGKTEIHMLDTFNKLTMHLLYKVAFSEDLGPLTDEDHPFLTSMKTALIGFANLLSSPLLAINPFKWRFRKGVREAIEYIRQSAKQMMTDRNVAKRNDDYVPHDLLEYIMELKEKHSSKMTDEVLLDNFLTFLVAGQETSANAMGFMISELARNPECYKKLQKEVDENIGAVAVITLNELVKLPYLDMVLKETLRLYPVAKASFRETTTDYVLSGHHIPAGTDMVVSFYATSRLEQNIRNPLEFLPERFDVNSPEKFSKYASTPFSIGPHTCLGKKFAEIEIKIIIAKIMQNFDFELIPGQTCEIKDNTLLQPKSRVKCFLCPRKTVLA